MGQVRHIELIPADAETINNNVQTVATREELEMVDKSVMSKAHLLVSRQEIQALGNYGCMQS